MENNTVVDDFTTVYLLHTIRKKVQEFQTGNKTNEVMCEIAEAYAALCPEQAKKESERLAEALKKIISGESSAVDEFSKIANSNRKAVKREEDNIEECKNRQKIRGALLTVIQEELQFNQIPINAEIVSIRIENKEGTEYYKISLADGNEIKPLKIVDHRGKKKSMCNFHSKKGEGLSNTAYEMIKECGKEGLSLQPVVIPSRKFNNITLCEYKKIAKIKGKLTDQEKNEFETYNLLEADDRKRMENVLKMSKLKRQMHQKQIDEIDKNKENIRSLLNLKFEEKDISPEQISEILLDTVQNIAEDRKNIWNMFSKKDEETSKEEIYSSKDAKYYSEYQKKINNIYSHYISAFTRVFEFQMEPQPDNGKMRQNLAELYTTLLRGAGNNPAYKEIITEVMTLGIFEKGIFNPSGLQELKKMNLLLNEMGINIRFEETTANKTPTESSLNAQEEKDRKIFRDHKKELADQKKILDDRIKIYKENTEVKKSDHHFIPLRCNGFTSDNLNRKGNYVLTACIHPWNLDLHDLTHMYDTRGEFLVLNKANSNLQKMTFNALKKQCDGSLTILSPVLQLKGEDGKFHDIMDKPSENRVTYCISDNNTPVIYTSLPSYCDNMSSLLKAKQNDEKDE